MPDTINNFSREAGHAGVPDQENIVASFPPERTPALNCSTDADKKEQYRV